MKTIAIYLSAAMLLAGCANPPQVQSTGSIAHAGQTYRLQVASIPREVKAAVEKSIREELAKRDMSEKADGELLIRVEFTAKSGSGWAPSTNGNAFSQAATSDGGVDRGGWGVAGNYTRNMVLTAFRSADQGFVWQARVVQEDPHSNHAEMAPELVRAAFASR